MGRARSGSEHRCLFHLRPARDMPNRASLGLSLLCEIQVYLGGTILGSTMSHKVSSSGTPPSTRLPRVKQMLSSCVWQPITILRSKRLRLCSFSYVSDLEENDLHVNYSKPVEDVFVDFAEACIRVGRIDFLSQCCRLSSEHDSLPSWVPDWSETSPNGPYWNTPRSKSSIGTNGCCRLQRLSSSKNTCPVHR
jgi:hypothetical protein